ncbi:hypothetical protein J5N97_006185 [Dioscorea zingiberensis]|uniref:Bulb-type lectin domain-containing protein n=1 Tax=Dioscorea zingiberensis TaxID=325984 RepID=A0A9D5HT56_9LILI|nr:hypothetical protein J5N97_006185 [Dioscorea zingiberensis]
MAIPRAVVALSLTLLLAVSPLCTAKFLLFSGETLYTGDFLAYAAYKFIMQDDCNLVLYDYDGPVWASNTGGLAKDCYATLQSDANLVIYTTNNRPVWASNTNRDQGYYVLILQKDRNVVIYGGAIWATNTHVDTASSAIVLNSKASIMEGFLPANATHGSNAAGIAMTNMVMAIPRAVVTLSLTLLLVASPLCTANYILYSGETLKSREALNWEWYTFIMQDDCNLVLYDKANPVWASNTGGLASQCYVTLQSDGNLVIYTTNKRPVWASNTNVGDGHYVLILQKDRNVVIYGGAIWATNTNVGVSSGAIFITSKASNKVGFFPANATHEAKAAGIAMVVNK